MIRIDAGPIIGQEDIRTRRAALLHGPDAGKVIVLQNIRTGAERHFDGIQQRFDTAAEPITRAMKKPRGDVAG